MPYQDHPLGFFLTWVCYGTWLPGDGRGWVEYRHGWQLPNPVLELEAAARMTEDACRLDLPQRELVEQTIRDHCDIRNWELHAVNCRSNHVHVVVTGYRDPKEIQRQFKAWCTRKLKEFERSRQGAFAKDVRENWWAERGSRRWINDPESLEKSVVYVTDGQDRERE